MTGNRAVATTLPRQMIQLARQEHFEVLDLAKSKIPDLSGFMKTEGIRNEPVTHRLPPDSLREETITQGRGLREKDADLYAVFLLCYDLWLRAGEVSNVQWRWIRRDHSNGTESWFLDVSKRADFKPKGKERSIPINDVSVLRSPRPRQPDALPMEGV